MDKISGLRARVMDAIFASGMPDDIAADMFAEMGHYIDKFGMYIDDEIPKVVSVKIRQPVNADQFQRDPAGTVFTDVSKQDLVEVQRFLENSDAVAWLKTVKREMTLEKGAFSNVIFGKMCVPSSLKWHAVSSGTCKAFWGSKGVELKPNIPVSLDVPESHGRLSTIGITNKGNRCVVTYWFTRDDVRVCQHGVRHCDSLAVRRLFDFLEYDYVINRRIRGKDPDPELERIFRGEI
jgi:hypothetical protein